MKLIWYICSVLIICLVGCNSLQPIEQVKDSFNRMPLEEEIEELLHNGYDSILYANGVRIDTYLKDVNCNFWAAMYPIL